MEKSDGYACIWSCNGSMFCQESGTFAFAACFVEKIVLLWILGRIGGNWSRTQSATGESWNSWSSWSSWRPLAARRNTLLGIQAGIHRSGRQFSSAFHVQAEPRSIELSRNLLELPGILPKIEFFQNPPVLL